MKAAPQCPFSNVALSRFCSTVFVLTACLESQAQFMGNNQTNIISGVLSNGAGIASGFSSNLAQQQTVEPATTEWARSKVSLLWNPCTTD